MTMAQLKLYYGQVCDKNQKDFLNDVFSSLLGSRGSEEAIDKLIEEN
jgi:hypothetical protein